MIYNWGKIGVLGLEYFFVLSSFLISVIILEEKKQTNSFNIPNFLVRRTLRVWPLYFLILAIGLIVVSLPSLLALDLDLQPLPPWPYLVFFLVNFYIIGHGTEFLFFIAFLWSISVEEQFYLLWSFIMKFIYKYFAVLCWVLIIASVVFRIVYLDSSRMLYFHTVSTLGNFGVGGLLALSVFKERKWIGLMNSLPLISISFIYLFIFSCVILFHEFVKSEIFMVFERLFYSILFAFLIAEQAFGRNHWFEFGRIKLFDHFGKISYGLYCFHGVIVTLFIQVIKAFYPNHGLWESIFLFPIIIFAATILISHLSYRYFERYFLGLKSKFYSFNP